MAVESTQTYNSDRWLVIANPTSGGGRVRRHWPKIERTFRDLNIPFDAVFTQRQGDATRLAIEGIERQGYRRLIAVGGDGNGNEVINGIFQQSSVPPSAVQYTILPVGTGNDWVKMHRIPSDFRQFGHMILRGNTTKQDLGFIHFHKNGQSHKHFFANAGGLAYDALVVHSVEYDRLFFDKKIAYFLHILKCLWHYRPEPVRIEADGKTFEGQFYTINFGINKYSGSGMQVTPHAIPDDGYLALTLIKDISKWRVLWFTPRLYLGNIDRIKRYVSTLQVKNIRVESLGKPILCETDGEFLGETPVNIGILEKELTVVVP